MPDHISVIIYLGELVDNYAELYLPHSFLCLIWVFAPRRIVGIQTKELNQQRLDLQAALKEKDVLLHEIHHRVKNNMQVTSSLLKLQSAHIKDKQVAVMQFPGDPQCFPVTGIIARPEVFHEPDDELITLRK